MQKNVHNYFPTFFGVIQKHGYGALILSGLLMYFFSFVSYLVPIIGIVIMGVMVVAVVWVTYRNLWWGMLILCFELIVGSLAGALFFFPFGGEIFLSIRKFIWLIVLVLWIVKGFKQKKWLPEYIRRSPFVVVGMMIFAAIAWGVIRSVTTGISLLSLYHDANGYAVFLIVFPLLWALAYEKGSLQEKEEQLYRVVGWGLILLSLFSLALLLLFSHAVGDAFPALYLWLRDTRIAEIGRLGDTSLYRIFIQSQMLLLIGFFVSAMRATQSSFHFRREWWMWVAMWAGLIVSLSRSLWIATMISGMMMVVWCFISKKGWRAVKNVCVKGSTSFGVALIVLAIVTTLGLNIFSLLGERSQFTLEEPAIRSRWDLWPALISKIKEHPVLGHGFGATVTYQTSDPRLRERGIVDYTTYAFEWGYLDIWIKMGLIGFVLFVGALIMMMKYGWDWARQSDIRLGWWFGMLAILIVHFFTPYLNHPIGIGIIIFFIGIVCSSNRKMVSK